MQAEFAAHRRKLFSFDQQYTYGLVSFDDKTISETLHVDQAARLRPSLLVQYGMNGLSVRDVHRADILSRLEPPALEEVLAAPYLLLGTPPTPYFLLPTSRFPTIHFPPPHSLPPHSLPPHFLPSHFLPPYLRTSLPTGAGQEDGDAAV